MLPLASLEHLGSVIVPLVEECEWRVALDGLPELSVIDKPLLVIAPHPDDETLGAGGLIKALKERQQSVRVVAVTDGENAYPGESGLAPIRRREQTEALAELGVPASDILRLGLIDSGLASQKELLVQQMLPLASADTHLLAPWIGDFHPDHEICGTAALEVARQTGALLSWYFFWTWHRGRPDLLSYMPLQRFPLSPDLLVAKERALQCHQSQLHWPNTDPILPEDLLAPARRPYEVFAPHV